MSPHTARLCLFCCFEVFLGKFTETSLFRPKSDYLRNEHWNTQKICISYHVWKGQILMKIWICLNFFFFKQTSKREYILTKTIFLHKVSHILLNYAFLLFKAFLRKFIENFSFRHKSDYLRNEHWNTQKVCLSYHVWKG